MKLRAPFYPDDLPWQEKIIIEPPWSRTVTSKVSINLESLTVPILLTTYIDGRREAVESSFGSSGNG